MEIKKYWIKMNTLNYHNCYRLRCPKCNHVYIMPQRWGVWKGCPTCWIELEYPYGENNENLK